jgi:UDP-N-acetylglucosamine 2-epimerase (non-hydrolysing)
MNEVLLHHFDEISESNILNNLNLNQNEFFVISAHREENINIDKNFQKLIVILNTLAEKFNFPVIVSTHPRTQKQITKSKIVFHEKVKLLKPLGYMDYIKLQMSSKVVISDSGTISEESSILNFPALNIREAHERPEAMEEASVMMVGLDIDKVLQGISILDNQISGSQRTLNNVSDYSSQNVSEKVVRIIHSYTSYVRRVVWREY